MNIFCENIHNVNYTLNHTQNVKCYFLTDEFSDTVAYKITGKITILTVLCIVWHQKYRLYT